MPGFQTDPMRMPTVGSNDQLARKTLSPQSVLGGGPNAVQRRPPHPALQAPVKGFLSPQQLAQLRGQKPIKIPGGPGLLNKLSQYIQTGRKGYGATGAIYKPGEGPVTSQVPTRTPVMPSPTLPQPTNPEGNQTPGVLPAALRQQAAAPMKQVSAAMTAGIFNLTSRSSGEGEKRALATRGGQHNAPTLQSFVTLTRLPVKTSAMRDWSKLHHFITRPMSWSDLKRTASTAFDTRIAQPFKSLQDLFAAPFKPNWRSQLKGLFSSPELTPAQIAQKYIPQQKLSSALRTHAYGEKRPQFKLAPDARGVDVDLSDVARKEKVDSEAPPIAGNSKFLFKRAANDALALPQFEQQYPGQADPSRMDVAAQPGIPAYSMTGLEEALKRLEEMRSYTPDVPLEYGTSSDAALNELDPSFGTAPHPDDLQYGRQMQDPETPTFAPTQNRAEDLYRQQHSGDAALAQQILAQQEADREAFLRNPFKQRNPSLGPGLFNVGPDSVSKGQSRGDVRINKPQPGQDVRDLRMVAHNPPSAPQASGPVGAGSLPEAFYGAKPVPMPSFGGAGSAPSGQHPWRGIPGTSDLLHRPGNGPGMSLEQMRLGNAPPSPGISLGQAQAGGTPATQAPMKPMPQSAEDITQQLSRPIGSRGMGEFNPAMTWADGTAVAPAPTSGSSPSELPEDAVDPSVYDMSGDELSSAATNGPSVGSILDRGGRIASGPVKAVGGLAASILSGGGALTTAPLRYVNDRWLHSPTVAAMTGWAPQAFDASRNYTGGAVRDWLGAMGAPGYENAPSTAQVREKYLQEHQPYRQDKLDAAIRGVSRAAGGAGEAVAGAVPFAPLGGGAALAAGVPGLIGGVSEVVSPPAVGDKAPTPAAKTEPHADPSRSLLAGEAKLPLEAPAPKPSAPASRSGPSPEELRYVSTGGPDRYRERSLASPATSAPVAPPNRFAAQIARARAAGNMAAVRRLERMGSKTPEQTIRENTPVNGIGYEGGSDWSPERAARQRAYQERYELWRSGQDPNAFNGARSNAAQNLLAKEKQELRDENEYQQRVGYLPTPGADRAQSSQGLQIRDYRNLPAGSGHQSFSGSGPGVAGQAPIKPLMPGITGSSAPPRPSVSAQSATINKPDVSFTGGRQPSVPGFGPSRPASPAGRAQLPAQKPQLPMTSSTLPRQRSGAVPSAVTAPPVRPKGVGVADWRSSLSRPVPMGAPSSSLPAMGAAKRSGTPGRPMPKSLGPAGSPFATKLSSYSALEKQASVATGAKLIGQYGDDAVRWGGKAWDAAKGLFSAGNKAQAGLLSRTASPVVRGLSGAGGGTAAGAGIDAFERVTNLDSGRNWTRDLGIAGAGMGVVGPKGLRSLSRGAGNLAYGGARTMGRNPAAAEQFAVNVERNASRLGAGVLSNLTLGAPKARHISKNTPWVSRMRMPGFIRQLFPRGRAGLALGAAGMAVPQLERHTAAIADETFNISTQRALDQLSKIVGSNNAMSLLSSPFVQALMTRGSGGSIPQMAGAFMKNLPKAKFNPMGGTVNLTDDSLSQLLRGLMMDRDFQRMSDSDRMKNVMLMIQSLQKYQAAAGGELERAAG